MSSTNDADTTVAELRKIVADFVAERDWSQFHSPKNVSMALAIEAAELMEHFQWITIEESRALANDSAKLAEVAEEIADVVGYSMALANELGIDLASSIRAKMIKNALKYPAKEYRGRYGPEDDGGVPVAETIAIVGASARAAAYSAVRAGFQPITADAFADLDLRRIATATRISPYPDGFLDWLRAIEPPAWMYTGALENHPELIDQMAWIAPLWGNPGDVLSQVRSPWLLRDALQSDGHLFPEIRAASDSLPRDGSWLEKTYRGASGSGVRSLHGTGSRGNSPTRGQESSHVYQQRVNGVACSGIFVAEGQSSSLLGISRQLIGEAWLTAREFQFCGAVAPYVPSKSAFAEVGRIGSQLAAQFSLIGVFGVDFMIDGDRVWTLEVNPRFTASVEVVERAAGVTALAVHAAQCSGSGREHFAEHSHLKTPTTNRDLRLSISHGKAIVFAKRPVVVSARFAEWALNESLVQPWPNIADISPAETPIKARWPVVTIFASGATDADVEQNLRDRVAEVEGKLYAD